MSRSLTESKINQINEEIIALWENQSEPPELAPKLYSKLKKGTLLFIGLNPSFSEEAFKNVLGSDKRFTIILEDIRLFYQLVQNKVDRTKISSYKEINNLFKSYKYFNKFIDLSNKTGLEWEHIDLLFIRKTKQEKVIDGRKLKKKSLPTFIQEQIGKSMRIMKLLKPVLVVVENATASRIIQQKENLKWDNSLGTYIWDSTPVFLSGMLTGQRALDLGSYDRLAWHINRVKKEIINSKQIQNKIGPQYSRDNKVDKTGFLKKARLHQSCFRALKLRVPHSKYGNCIKQNHGLMGLNFYNDFNIFQEVQRRYPKYKKDLYSNLLRSEHIPFNLFIPFKEDLSYCKNVFSNFLNNQIFRINKIEIEYAPKPKTKYLNDRTSFDTYIEYIDLDNKKGILGIEVKYTERDYKLKKGSKEESYVRNKNSVYYMVSKESEIYKPGAVRYLSSDTFRQIWRNQLLGESILVEDNVEFKYFTSVTIFPEGNLHFMNTSKEYIRLLKDQRKFIHLTFESFITIAKKFSPGPRYNRWLSYLTGRYLIT